MQQEEEEAEVGEEEEISLDMRQKVGNVSNGDCSKILSVSLNATTVTC